MSGYVWTLEELDRVHPLPEPNGSRLRLYPWAWRLEDGEPMAVEVGPAEPNAVWVDNRGCLASADGEPLADVALAVILASMGLPSLTRSP